jgi:hypothetical protein
MLKLRLAVKKEDVLRRRNLAPSNCKLGMEDVADGVSRE